MGVNDIQVSQVRGAWSDGAKVPTIDERIAHVFGYYGLGSETHPRLRTLLVEAFTAALTADRQERADDDTTGHDPAADDDTPEAQARGIVAGWASAHRVHRPRYPGHVVEPDTGRASLDDLEGRIAAALAARRMG